MKREDRRMELSSAVVKAGHRVYFIDAKADSLGNRFLAISEVKNSLSSEGSRERQRIHVYEEDLPKFLYALNGAITSIKQDGAGDKGTPGIDIPNLEDIID